MLPGNQMTDYGYTQAWYDDFDILHYELFYVQDALANDALAAGVRTDSSAVTTAISTDYLNRVSAVWYPTANEDDVLGDFRTFDRYPSALDKSYYGRVDIHNPMNWEPNGFLRSVKYDNLYRVFEDTDMTNLTTSTEWDQQRDLRYSTTTPEGLKTTAIYDDEDRPVESYGPAPKAWFGTDRKPLAAYVNQVPRSQSTYDSGIVGPQVAYYNYKATNKTLFGAPKLHTTGVDTANPGLLKKSWTPAPITPDSGMSGWGLRATGRLRVPTTGTYTFHLWHDDGARLFVDDQYVTGDWNNGANRRDVGTKVLEAGKPYRFYLEYYDNTSSANGSTIDVFMSAVNAQPAASDDNWGQKLLPDYSLTTSTKAFDSQVGDVTSTLNYGTQPEFGLVNGTTTAGGSLSFATTNTFETPGTGYLRKLSSVMPGGGKTTYAYYGATETADNPYTTGTTEAFKQGGQLKTKTSLDPDDTGALAGQTTTTIYDEAGRAVATRANSDSWTCTAYDARGRVAQIVVPTINGRTGRTLTYNYAVGGNPFVSSLSDTVTGTKSVEIDLLGRVLRTVDTFGYETAFSYNEFNQVSNKKSIKGGEDFYYDEFGRLTNYALEDAENYGMYAFITYDDYNRVSSIQYPDPTDDANSRLTLDQVKRDATEELIGATYSFSNGATYDETVSRTLQTGKVTGSTVTYGGKIATTNYQYDAVGRLTTANIDNWRYQYAFGTQDTTCTGLTGYNANANKNGNRTSTTVTNTITGTVTATKHCYNFADQLIKSTDTQLGTPTYDTHGNITQLAGGSTPITFAYNASDQNISITQGTNKVEYTKDADGNVLIKKEYRNNVLDKVYRNASGAMLTCNVTNQSQCAMADRYYALPGGVALTLTNTSPTTVVAKYSIQNFHGDTALVLDTNGVPSTSVYMYDPFGRPVASNTFGTNNVPDNATGNGMGWATSPARKQESMFTLPIMQMGARVYLPTIGRFIQVDPTEGGTPNAYTYVLDPINYADYNGQWGVPKWLKNPVAVVVAAVAVVGAVAACILLCVEAAVAIAASAPVVAVTTAVTAVTVRAAPYIARVPALVAKASSAARAAASKIGGLVRMGGSGQAVTSTANGASRISQVGTANLPKIPTGWVGRVADNGKGMVYQQPGSIGNANMIRIMEPTKQFPNGYIRIYNQYGQPVDILGVPGPQSTTHIPIDYQGIWVNWPK
jgi:RHS repeat-associated protein